MPRPTNVGLRNQMIAYQDLGVKQGEIARRLGVTRQTVNKGIRLHLEHNVMSIAEIYRGIW